MQSSWTKRKRDKRFNDILNLLKTFPFDQKENIAAYFQYYTVCEGEDEPL